MLPAIRLRAVPWLWLWLWLCVWLCLSEGAAGTAGPQPANHDLLSSLGLVRRRVAPAHHRKRLAAEMRSSGAADDSHMVLIKLPPAPYYYAHAKPQGQHPSAEGKEKGHPNAVSKPALRFRGNGKPSAVYHWNLPVIKKMKASHAHAHAHARRGGGAAKRTSDGDSHIYHIRKAPASDPAHAPAHAHASDNDVLKGGESADAPAFAPSNAHAPKKPQGPKAKISYYTPRRKAMFQKLFQGNGKPHSFYVIEKSKKPIHYHRLMP